MEQQQNVLSNTKLIRKRDKRIKEYDISHVRNAVRKSYKELGMEKEFQEQIGHIIVHVNSRVMSNEEEIIDIEEIQDYVVEALTKVNKEVAKAYSDYREQRTRARDFDFADRIKNEIINVFSTENSNANIDENTHGGRELRALETLEKMMADMTMPKDLVELNNSTLLKEHDYAKTVLGMHNCLLIDYPKLLANGIETRQADTKPCQSYMSACQMLAVIMQSQSLDMFGGCGLMNFSIYMVPYLKKSISKLTKDIIDLLDLDIDLNSISNELQFKQAKDILGGKLFYSKFLPRIKSHVAQSNQALITNLVTLQSRSGHQLPFSSINLGLIDWDNEYESAFINQLLLEELDKGIGKHDRTAIFPILCFQVKGGVNRYPMDKYYSQRLLAQRISHHRLYPTIVNCDFSQNKATDWESEFNMMGCRTMLGRDINNNNSYSRLGRGNNLPVTMNLPYLALMCKRDNLDFWEELDKLLLKARKALLFRYDIIRKQKTTAVSFMHKNKTMSFMEDCIDTIEESVKHNTLAIGYIGIAEACKVMTGHYHCEGFKESEEFGYKIVKRIKDFCEESTEEYKLNFSVYASPSEGFCEQALKGIRKEFGVIEGVSDRDFITNSHHCPVWMNLSVFEKVDIESRYAPLSTGGNIFHIEIDGVNYNEKAVTKAIDYALDHDIPYIRLSHPIATCFDCNYSIGHTMDKCEACGSENIENLAIVTGYLSSDIKFMNKGKQDEVKNREEIKLGE